MKKQIIGALAIVASAAAVIWQLSVPVAAQDENNVSGVRVARAPAGPVPRSADGKPDFQGFWQSGAGATGAAPNNNIEDHPPSFVRSGGKSTIVDPPDGKIPYQPWALKERDIRRLPENSYDDPEGHCYPSGVPRQMYIMPYLILQPAGHIVMLYEYIHARRVIPFNRPHLPGDIRPWEGDSVAHWDGDTLVVDTTNSNGKLWFELSGNFMSDAAHQVERFTMVDANRIDYRVTIEDPKVLTRPFTMAFPLVRITTPKMELLESACHEDNRDLEHLRAIRDTAAAKAKVAVAVLSVTSSTGLSGMWNLVEPKDLPKPPAGLAAAGGQDGFNPKLAINQTLAEFQMQGTTYHQYPEILTYKLDGSEKITNGEDGTVNARVTRDGDKIVLTTKRTFTTPAGTFSVERKDVYGMADGMLSIERTETTNGKTIHQLARYRKAP